MFRVALGALVASDAVARARDLTAHYTDAGYLPRGEHLAKLNHGWVVSLHALSGGAAWQALLFWLTIIAGLLLLVGWRTRLATIACWVLVLSAQVRLPTALSGADTLLRLLLFWSMFLPLGARFSLDRRRVTGISLDAISPPTRVRSIAVTALFVQVALVYLVSAIWKRGSSWTDGVAIQYVLGIEPYATALGARLQEHPLLLRWMTVGVLWLEWVGPFAFFSPWRTSLVRGLAVAGFAAFQLGLLLTMRLGPFPLVNLVALLPLVPVPVWDRVFGAGRDVEARALSRPARIAVAAALAYVLVWNVSVVLKRSLGPLAIPAYALQLEQGWSVFAPELPTGLDGWWTAPAKTESGEIDLFRACFAGENAPPSSAKPADARGWRLLGHRWAHVFQQARLYEEDRPYVAAWLCRCGPPVESVRLVFFQEEPVLNRPPAATPLDLGTFACP